MTERLEGAERVAAFALADGALTACGGTGAAKGPTLSSERTEAAKEVTEMEMASGPQTWRISLADGAATRDLLAQLPLRLTLRDFADSEKIAKLPRPLSRAGAPASVVPRRGDVAFYAPWGNIAIFYRDGHDSGGLVPLGRIAGDVDALARSRRIAVTLRRADGR